MSEFKEYICCKQVRARPLSRREFAIIMGTLSDFVDEPGYLVVYNDGYESWVPKKVFDAGYTQKV